jgi:hypothetical protein
MYLQSHYTNIIRENDDIETMTSKKQVMTVPFYFIDKDPETGKRRSTPIKDEYISIEQCITLFEKIGFTQLVNMYLIE